MPQVPEDDAIIEVQAIFRGRVQGVGFRATTKHYASQLRLKGTVRNCDDGSVEAYIQGPYQIIQKLFQLIHHEMGLGQVTEIIQHTISPLHSFEGFQIIR